MTRRGLRPASRACALIQKTFFRSTPWRATARSMHFLSSSSGVESLSFAVDYAPNLARTMARMSSRSARADRAFSCHDAGAIAYTARGLSKRAPPLWWRCVQLCERPDRALLARSRHAHRDIVLPSETLIPISIAYSDEDMLIDHHDVVLPEKIASRCHRPGVRNGRIGHRPRLRCLEGALCRREGLPVRHRQLRRPHCRAACHHAYHDRGRATC